MEDKTKLIDIHVTKIFRESRWETGDSREVEGQSGQYALDICAKLSMDKFNSQNSNKKLILVNNDNTCFHLMSNQKTLSS